MVTVTYAKEHLPYSKQGEPTLDKSHASKYTAEINRRQKRWCKKNGVEFIPVRYFLTGEYGTKRKRPHYHLILFNLNRKLLKDFHTLWPHGSTDLVPLEPGGIDYVTKYLIDEDREKRNRRQRPFNMMTKRPGLGYRYFEKNAKWHKANEGTHIEDQRYYVLVNGHKMNIPRYYKKKIFSPWDMKAHGTLARIKKEKELERLIRSDFENYERKDALRMIAERVKHKHDQIKIKSEKRNKL